MRLDLREKNVRMKLRDIRQSFCTLLSELQIQKHIGSLYFWIWLNLPSQLFKTAELPHVPCCHYKVAPQTKKNTGPLIHSELNIKPCVLLFLEIMQLI